MITYDWNCKAVNVRPLEGGEVDVVYNVDWIVTGTSDIPAPEGFSPEPSPFYFAVDMGLQDLAWDPESTFIPFEDLTNEIVVGWTQAAIGEEGIANIEASIASQIENLIHPTSIALIIGDPIPPAE